MREIKSVPMPIFENEMQHKDNIIKLLIGLMFTIILVLCFTIYMFVKFIGSYDLVSYEQHGKSNKMNIKLEGDDINESKISY